MLAPWEESYDKPRQHIEKQRHHFANKDSYSQSYVFFICLFVCFPVVIYGCKGWTIKKAEHQRTDTFKLWYWKRLSRVPWTSRRSNQSILKEMNSGYPIGRADVEAEVPVLWPPDMKSLLIGKDSDAGKDWSQKKKGAAKNKMFRQHHWQWIWIWANFGRLWITEESGVLLKLKRSLYCFIHLLP